MRCGPIILLLRIIPARLLSSFALIRSSRLAWTPPPGFSRRSSVGWDQFSSIAQSALRSPPEGRSPSIASASPPSLRRRWLAVPLSRSFARRLWISPRVPASSPRVRCALPPFPTRCSSSWAGMPCHSLMPPLRLSMRRRSTGQSCSPSLAMTSKGAGIISMPPSLRMNTTHSSMRSLVPNVLC
ncbi:Uncharacterised protein [Collinsella intestinalis]|nr:Uncharacterised protein [Collinsella intestinalis]